MQTEDKTIKHKDSAFSGVLKFIFKNLIAVSPVENEPMNLANRRIHFYFK